MLVRVTPHQVKILRGETEPINEKEIDISKCYFEFDEEIEDDYVKEAYFTLNGNTYKQIIVNNECDYPGEVLTQKGELEIGVVAYKVEDEQEIKRYNPSPDFYETWIGSLKDAENSEPITPSDKEQMEQAILNLQNNKQDTLVSGENIKTLNNESLLGSGNIEIEVDLSNYYTKAETYSKAEVNGLIPDLTNYVKNTDYATSSKGGVIKTPSTLGISVGSTGNVFALSSTYADYGNRPPGYFIGKETLDNVITGKGLVSDTDYANANKGGVIKATGDYSFSVDNQGRPNANVLSYSNYLAYSFNNFISKGTLENVITGKELVNKTYVDNIVGDIETILTTLDIGGGISGN